MSEEIKGTSESKPIRDVFLAVLREYSEALVIAVFVALLLRIFVFSAYRVPTNQMDPNLLPGDFILAYKLPYVAPVMDVFNLGPPRVALPELGSVLAFHCPYSPSVLCIKRVVGLPGDLIEIKGKRLIRNQQVATYQRVVPEDPASGQGIILWENLGSEQRKVRITKDRERENFGPVPVPPGHVFVLSDHRDGGVDSREWGPIPLASLRAEAVFIWISLEWQTPTGLRQYPKIRWERLFQPIH